MRFLAFELTQKNTPPTPMKSARKIRMKRPACEATVSAMKAAKQAKAMMPIRAIGEKAILPFCALSASSE